MLLLSARSTLPIFNLTFYTNPLSSQYICMTLQICQSFLMVFASFMITMSPLFKFLLVFVHFFLSRSDCRNSFLQRHQNSFAMCWTCLYLLWLYKSGLEKSPGGRKTIFDFMVKVFDGDRDKLLVRSLVLSVGKSREFTISSLPLTLQVIPHQLSYYVFASEKKWWNRLNWSNPLKHHPYGWHKEGSFSKQPNHHLMLA